MFCVKCGNSLVEGSEFCCKCSNEIKTDRGFTIVNALPDSVTTEEFELFVGVKKQQYYISKWLKFKGARHNKYISLNWPALFLTFFWLAYRKMYLYAIASSTIFFILTIIVPHEFATSLNISLCVFLGIYGNKIYCYYSGNEIAKIKNNLTNLSQQKSEITNKGGTNISFTIIFTVVYLVSATFYAALIN